MPTSFRPVYISRGSPASLRNPCPAGTSLGTGDFNGTIVLICDAAFNKVTSDEINVELALGLGLGLGLPFLIAIAVFIFCQCREAQKFQVAIEKAEKTEQERLAATKRNDSPPADTRLNIVSLLTNDAYLDFTHGFLTDKLKKELTNLQPQVGTRPLVMEAKKRGADVICKWLVQEFTFPTSKPVELEEARVAMPTPA